MVAKTNRERLMEYIAAQGVVTPTEVSNKLGFSRNAAGVYLAKLKKRGLVDNPQYGMYVLTELGKQRTAKINPTKKIREVLVPLGEKLPVQKNQRPKIDLEDINTIIELKEQYGKDRLLKIIDKIRVLLREE
jgi:predicted transcriptional regulator